MGGTKRDVISSEPESLEPTAVLIVAVRRAPGGSGPSTVVGTFLEGTRCGFGGEGEQKEAQSRERWRSREVGEPPAKTTICLLLNPCSLGPIRRGAISGQIWVHLYGSGPHHAFRTPAGIC